MQCVSDVAQKKEAKRYAVLLIGGLLVLLFAAIVPYLSKYSTIGVSPANQPSLAVSDLLKNPNEFMGQRVKVLALVNNNVNTHAMVVDQDDSIMGDEVLVVSKNALEPVGGGGGDVLFNEGNDVVVTGTVGRFDRQQLEQQLGVPLDPDTFARWNGRPYIVADNVSNP